MARITELPDEPAQGIRLPSRGRAVDSDSSDDESQSQQQLADVEIPEELRNDPNFQHLVSRFARAVHERDVERQLPGDSRLTRQDVKPGFCFQVDLEKEHAKAVGLPFLYVNVGHSAGMPDTTLPASDELVRALEDPNAALRLPILVGELKKDTENGKPCGMVDVCVASKIVERASRDPVFRHAVALLTLDWIEDRSPEFEFDRGTIRVLKVPCKGKLGVHYVRSPLVTVVDAPSPTTETPKQAAETKQYVPPVLSISEGTDHSGKPVVRVDVRLELLDSAASLVVELDSDRLYVDVPGMYHWNCRLPSDFDGDTAMARFVKKSRTLRVVAAKRKDLQ